MSTEASPRYAGPRALAESLSQFARMSAADATWNREGLRDDSEYRDLGLAAATGGRIGAKHIRALKPLPAPTGWHWHDMTAHYVFVLRGSLTFRFAGVGGDVTLQRRRRPVAAGRRPAQRRSRAPTISRCSKSTSPPNTGRGICRRRPRRGDSVARRNAAALWSPGSASAAARWRSSCCCS